MTTINPNSHSVNPYVERSTKGNKAHGNPTSSSDSSDSKKIVHKPQDITLVKINAVDKESLAEVITHLNRLNTLKDYSAREDISSDSLAALQQEVSMRLDDIDRIAKETGNTSISADALGLRGFDVTIRNNGRPDPTNMQNMQKQLDYAKNQLNKLSVDAK